MDLKLTQNLDENIAMLQKVFQDDNTVVFRRIKSAAGQDFAILFLDGMVNSEMINLYIVAPLETTTQQVKNPDALVSSVLRTDDASVQLDMDQLMLSFLYGDAVVLMQGSNQPIRAATKGFGKRSIAEPENERVISGPREGFTESFMTNLSLLRRRILNPDLKFTFMRIGTHTNTTVCICYLKGVCEESIVREMKTRLSRINMDSVLDSNYIKEEISDHRWAPFPTVGTSERPDVIASRILEGRCAVIVDGSPVVLSAPYVFQECFQANDDYYTGFWQGSITRALRYLGYFASITIGGLYVALLLHHRELIPARLLFAIMAAHRGVPFPVEWETILMFVVFEALKEAGVRTPGPMGQTMSIVGGLVLGQAAVSARFSAAPTVIMVATVGVTSLMAPKLQTSSIVLRFATLIAGAVFGLYGVLAVLAIALLLLCKMNSFSVPYLINMVPRKRTDQQDAFVRVPWFLMKKDRNLKRRGERR